MVVNKANFISGRSSPFNLTKAGHQKIMSARHTQRLVPESRMFDLGHSNRVQGVGVK